MMGSDQGSSIIMPIYAVHKSVMVVRSDVSLPYGIESMMFTNSTALNKVHNTQQKVCVLVIEDQHGQVEVQYDWGFTDKYSMCYRFSIELR